MDRNAWRTRLGKAYAPVVRQTTEWLLADLMITFPNSTYRLYFYVFYGSQNTQQLFPYIPLTVFYN